jgi:hypothetical protein
MGVTKEHVFPHWLGKQLGKAKLHSVRFIRPTSDDAWTSIDVGIQVRMPCASCNNGWMSSLEMLVQPVIGHLVTSGQTLSLTVDDRKHLAAWAMKTVMVMEYLGENPPYYTADDRRTVKDTLSPPANVWIWVGQYLGRATTHWSVLAMRTNGVRSGTCTTLSLGRLVLQVFAYRGAPTDRIPMIAGDWAQALLAIWPIGPNDAVPAEWPPASHLDDEYLAVLGARFSGKLPTTWWHFEGP